MVEDDENHIIGKKKKKRKNKHKPSAHGSDSGFDVNVESELHQDDSEPRIEDLSSTQTGKDSNSDTDDQPSKKRKKKLTMESDKKGKKSIRQMKREKHAQRQAEAEASAKSQHKQECLNYLHQWKYDKQNWKFMKIKQVWLSKNMFSADLVPNDFWPILLQYFESAQGGVRKILLDNAHKVIQQMDEWTESQNQLKPNNEEESLKTSEVLKPDDIAYNRARDLIQCLE